MLTARKAKLLSQTLNPRKVFNFGRLYSSFYISKWKGEVIHWGNPTKIGIEPTTHCNLRCPECISGLRAFSRPTGSIDLDLFRNTIDQVYRDLIYLLLYFQGEPYLHPNFLDMAAYARSKSIFSATSTNGHYLSDEKARQTVESGISEVIISIDGTTQETYQAYRVGGKLEKVINGVRNLVHWREKLKSLSPHIVIQFLVVKPNEHQINDIRLLGRNLGVDKVALKTAQIYDYEDGSQLIPTLTKYSRYRKQPNGKYAIKNRLDNQCWKLWQGAEVSWDGRVLPCCFDKDGKYVMGKLSDASFQHIWNGDAYQAFRNSILQARSEIEMCQNCTEGTKVWA